MEEKKELKKILPPYLPYKTLRNFIDNMKVGIPNRIDRSLMGTMAGSLRPLVISALEYLQLITPKTGIPEEKLIQLVKSEGVDRQSILKEILISTYTFLFVNDFDLKGATLHELQDSFSQTGATGDTLRKCIVFFLSAAKDAGMGISPHIKTTPGPRVGTKQRKRINPSQKLNGNGDDQLQPTIPQEKTPTKGISLENILLDRLLEKFPVFNPQWEPDVQAKWFEGFDKLTERFKNKSEE